MGLNTTAGGTSIPKVVTSPSTAPGTVAGSTPLPPGAKVVNGRVINSAGFDLGPVNPDGKSFIPGQTAPGSTSAPTNNTIGATTQTPGFLDAIKSGVKTLQNIATNPTVDKIGGAIIDPVGTGVSTVFPGIPTLGGSISNGTIPNAIVHPSTIPTAVKNVVTGAVNGIGSIVAPTGGPAPGAPLDTGSLNTQIAAAAALRDKAANAAPSNISAPVAQSAQLGPVSNAALLAAGPVAQATASQIGGLPQVAAPNVGGAQQIQASTVGPVRQAVGGSVQAGQVGTIPQVGVARAAPAQQAIAGQIGSVPIANAGQVGGVERVGDVSAEFAPAVSNGGPINAQQATASQLNQTPEQQFRDQQQNLVGYLNGAITGQAPSVAQQQLDRTTQDNESNQLGLAAGASRGGNSALAMRTAANNIGMINQKAASDAALLRAQEVATARGQENEVLNTGRTTDVNVAGQNAGMETGVSQSNAQLGTQAALTHAQLAEQASQATSGNMLATNTLQAQLIRQAQMTNAANSLQAGSTQAGLVQGANITNAGNILAANTTNAQLGTQASLGNASNSLATNSLNAQLQQQASLANAGNALSAQTAQAGFTTQAGIATAGNQTTASTTNANNSLAQQLAQAQLSQAASTGNAANATSLQSLQAQLLFNASHDNAGNALSAAQTNANLATQVSLGNAGSSNASALQTQSLGQGALNLNANNANTLNINQGQLSNATNIANAGNAVTTAGQNVTANQNNAANALTASGQAITGATAPLGPNASIGVANINAASAADTANKQITAAAVGGLAKGVGDALPLSDKRTKTNVKSGEASAQDLLDHLKARSFEYIDQSNGKGPQTGVMAQDVEKTKAGKAFVRETPRGKALDPVAGFGTVLSMLATLNQRMKKVEGARRGA